MSQEELYINGELLRLRREARGWVLNDMATRACMSTKQIRQLEEGGMSSFYSVAVKATAAKKVAGLLGISEAEVFGHAVQVEAQEEVLTSDEVTEEVLANLAEDAPAPTISELQAADKASLETESSGNHLSAHDAESPKESEKNNTSLWVIVLLFASALGVAAYMRPADEVPVEAAPPLQVLPAEATEAASAASAAEMPASASSAVADMGVVVSQKTASASATSSSSAPAATSVIAISSAPRAPQPVAAPVTAASKAP